MLDVDTVAAAEQPEQTDQDEVDRHDEIQQPWHDQNQDAGNQRDNGTDGDRECHGWDLVRDLNIPIRFGGSGVPGRSTM